jgi:hypothetical protein
MRVFLALILAGAGLTGLFASHDATPATTAPRTATVWAVGDGDGSANAASVVRRVLRSHPARFLYLGDVYPGGSDADFARNYSPTYGRLARRTWPTPGNHDAGAGYHRYWKGVRGRAIPGWYATSAGGWQILSLDSEAAHDTGSAQLRWLRSRVRGRGTCRIAFWHRPRFSAGLHGDEASVAPFWRVLRGHAAIVLNGHDHDSQRFRPVAGITEFVAGAGGHGLYPVRRGKRGLAFADDRHYAALRLRLRRGLARYAFVTAGGRTLDSGRIRCSRARR